MGIALLDDLLDLARQWMREIFSDFKLSPPLQYMSLLRWWSPLATAC